MDLLEVQRALRESWSAETAYPDKVADMFDEGNPARNQCAVSSLVILHYFGGEIYVGKTNKGGRHYWNVIDGMHIDSTREQFGPDEYVLNGKPASKTMGTTGDTNKRYRLLLHRVQEVLAR